jgi:calcium-dependent protein kinase
MKLLVDLLLGFIELIKNGIIHRDLKPENILIHDGTFKLAGLLFVLILDFGLSVCVNNISKDLLNTIVGTPLYMSP